MVEDKQAALYKCTGCSVDLLIDIDKNPATIDFVVCKKCFTPTHKDCAGQYGCSTYACRSKEFYEGDLQKEGLETIIQWVDGTGTRHPLTNHDAPPAPSEQPSRREAILRENRQLTAGRWYRRIRNVLSAAALLGGLALGVLNYKQSEEAQEAYANHPQTAMWTRVRDAQGHLDSAIELLRYRGSNPGGRDESGNYTISYDHFPNPAQAREQLTAARDSLKQAGHFQRPALEKRIEDAMSNIKDKVHIEVDVGKSVTILDSPVERATLAALKKETDEIYVQATRALPTELEAQAKRSNGGSYLGFLAAGAALLSFSRRRFWDAILDSRPR